jgi:uncharacterized membrane protein
MTSSRPNYLKSWMLFFLIASVGGALAGGVFGAVAGGMMGAGGVPLNRVVQICKIIGFVVSMPISFFTFRWSVRTYIVEAMPPASTQPPAL